MNPSKNHLSHKLIEVISNPVFPELDTQLRAGRHICAEDLEKHAFVHEYFDELDKFYRRYSVELIRAPEDFYYLRTKSTSILPSSQLSELEMLCGKILCLLYLSPERLAQQGIFTVQEVYDELISLIEVERLVKLINPRSTGSDLDKAKLQEKLRAALNRLARMGIISFLVKDKDSNNKFLIRSSCFRFGAEVRSGEDVTEAQEKLIRMGEIVTPESLAERERALKALAKDDTTAAQASASLANAQVGAAAAASVASACASATAEVDDEATSSELLTAQPATSASFAQQQGVRQVASGVSELAEQHEAADEQDDLEATDLEALFAAADEVEDSSATANSTTSTSKSASGYQWAEDDDWEDDDDWDEFDDLDDDDFDEEDEDDDDDADEPVTPSLSAKSAQTVRAESEVRKQEASEEVDADELVDETDTEAEADNEVEDEDEYEDEYEADDEDADYYVDDSDIYDLEDELNDEAEDEDADEYADNEDEDDEDFIIDVNSLADLDRFDYNADDEDERA